MRLSGLPYLYRCGLLMSARLDQLGKIEEVKVGVSKTQEFTIPKRF